MKQILRIKNILFLFSKQGLAYYCVPKQGLGNECDLGFGNECDLGFGNECMFGNECTLGNEYKHGFVNECTFDLPLVIFSCFFVFFACNGVLSGRIRQLAEKTEAQWRRVVKNIRRIK